MCIYTEQTRMLQAVYKSYVYTTGYFWSKQADKNLRKKADYL